MEMMLVRWLLKVERLCSMLCSSPISAKTALEDGQLGARLGRDEQAGLRHQRQQPDRLERHGLAAGVRAGDQQHLELVAQHHVDRHDVARSASGWRAADQIDAALAVERGRAGRAAAPP